MTKWKNNRLDEGEAKSKDHERIDSGRGCNKLISWIRCIFYT